MKDSIQILMVDDDLDNIHLVEKSLKDANFFNFDLEQVNNIAAAKDCLFIKKVDLILLDLKLSANQGMQIFDFLKSCVSLTPVITFSDSAGEEVAVLSVKEGAQSYLIKGNFDGKLLSRTIVCAIERDKFERKLQEYASVVQNASIGIININLKGEITDWNKAAESMYGYSKAEAIGKNIAILTFSGSKNDFSNLAKELTKKQVIRYEEVRQCKENRKIEVLVSLTPITDKLGQVVGIAEICQDITLHKLSEQQLAIEFRVTKSLSESSNLQNAGYIILKTCCDILGWKTGQIWTVNSAENVLQLTSLWDGVTSDPSAKQAFAALTLQKNEGIPGKVWQAGKYLWLEDCRQNGGESCCGFPIFFNREMVGVLVFFGIEMQYQKQKQKLIDLFTTICDQIGIFIKRKRIEGDLLYFRQHDALTSLLNRSTFEDALSKAIVNAQSQKRSIALFYLDLDFFKNINDLLGHDSGDALLQGVANILKETIGDANLIARFGGDEFAIYLPNLQSEDEILLVAKAIIAALARPIEIGGNEFSIRVSIGISIYPEDGNDVNTLLKKADGAMHQAKGAGGNSVFFSKNMDKINKSKVTLESDLYRALERNELFLCYQPIANMQTNAVEGVEALLRWRRPGGKILSPDMFIPLAEKNRLIFSIGTWVIKNACLQLSRYPDIFKFPIFVNVSVKQLYENFIENVAMIIKETGIDPTCLIFEITESTLIQQTENTIYILSGLKKMGINISLDDFGTGYSSLSYLQKFSAPYLKIDKSFVGGLPHNTNSQAIINAVIALAHSLNMKVTAEGVETPEQLAWLQAKNCDRYQGFLFSKPLAIADLQDFLNRKHNGSPL